MMTDVSKMWKVTWTDPTGKDQTAYYPTYADAEKGADFVAEGAQSAPLITWPKSAPVATKPTVTTTVPKKGVSAWVWLVGGGLVLWLITRKGK